LVVASRESAVVDRLGSRTAFDTFSLSPLTQAEAVQYLRRLLPDPSLRGPAFEQLALRADGNPLLLNLFASYLQEYGDLATFERTDTIRTVLDRHYQPLGLDHT